MAQDHFASLATGLSGKAEAQHSEISQRSTGQGLPEAAKAEGGVLLNAEGVDGASSLRLASDGRVSVIRFLILCTEYCTDKPFIKDGVTSSANR